MGGIPVLKITLLYVSIFIVIEALQMRNGQQHCRTYSFQNNAAKCEEMVLLDFLDFLKDIPNEAQEIYVLGCRKPIYIGSLDSVAKRPSVHILKLSQCHMSSVPQNIFQLFPNLSQLHLDGNHIGDIQGNEFEGSNKLELLNLSDNSLKNFNSGILQKASELVELDISYNELETLPQDAFVAVPRLERLHLQNNYLQMLYSSTFEGLGRLQYLFLHDNMLDGLQVELFNNMPNLTDLFLAGNPWDCHCGFEQLLSAIDTIDKNNHNQTTDNFTRDNILKDRHLLQCRSPTNLAGRYVHDLSFHAFECETPALENSNSSLNVDLLFMNSLILNCNTSGVPSPSLYWVTPRGVVTHPVFAKWLPNEMLPAVSELTYAGQPTFYRASIQALENGSLWIHHMRHQYSGQYTCVALSPGGNTTMSVEVVVASNIETIVNIGVLYGAATMAIFLVLSLIFGGVRKLVERFVYKKKPIRLADGTTFTVSEHDIIPGNIEDLDDFGSVYSSMYSLHWYSPEDSPLKCVTPAEQDIADEQFNEMANSIRETLEDARTRLRCGMERQVFRIRNRAANVRNSGSRYMHTLRETGSKKLYNIRESGSKQLRNIRLSSSQYANRVRAGMTLGVEQVKYHVQSMKELCGTGEMSHTISTVSVSTDVDSRRKTEVIRTITYV